MTLIQATVDNDYEAYDKQLEIIRIDKEHKDKK